MCFSETLYSLHVIIIIIFFNECIFYVYRLFGEAKLYTFFLFSVMLDFSDCALL